MVNGLYGFDIFLFCLSSLVATASVEAEQKNKIRYRLHQGTAQLFY